MRGVERALKEKRARCIVPLRRKTRRETEHSLKKRGRGTWPRDLMLRSSVYVRQAFAEMGKRTSVEARDSPEGEAAG